MRLRSAAVTAVECSAALPRIATTNTPTKTSLSPSACEVGSIAPTRISLIHAIAAVAAASTPAARPRLQAAACPSSAGCSPAKSFACVTSEKTRLAA